MLSRFAKALFGDLADEARKGFDIRFHGAASRHLKEHQDETHRIHAG